MNMFPHTVTIINHEIVHDKSTAKDTEYLYFTVLDGVFMDSVKGKSTQETGLVNADSVTLYIPENVTAKDGGLIILTDENGVTLADELARLLSEDRGNYITAKKYASPISYWGSDDKSEIWTVSPKNTYIVKGKGIDPTLKIQKIEAAHDYVYNVTKVDYMDFGGGMAHWEVWGV